MGEDVFLEFTRPRSIRQLRLYWALVGIAFDNNQNHFASKDEASDSIKLACGLSTTTHIKYHGQWFERKTPASIAFASMQQNEFNTFFEKAIGYICTELIPGLDPETLEIEVRALA
jgi:hypothetical protein